MREIVSRKDALVRGLKRFFTGKPCRHGHLCEKITSSKQCMECNRVRCAKRMQDTAFRQNAAKLSAEWRAQNPERNEANVKRWRDAHPERIRGYSEAWKKANPEKNRDILQRCGRVWRKNNPERLRLHAKSRNKRVSRSTPPWVDRSAIREIYANRPVGHDVDHIIPLNGKTVSGLHVPWNLQYLPALKNRAKGNRWQPDECPFSTGEFHYMSATNHER